MFQLLIDPVEEIKRRKKQSFATIFLYLVAASLFETVGALFFYFKLQTIMPKFAVSSAEMVMTGVMGLLMGLIVSHLIVAFFFAVAMHVLDGKGGYYEALTALVLAFVAPAVSIFFGGAASFLPLGGFLALTLITLGYVVGAATLFRSTKELFHVDYAGVFAGLLITAIPLGIASYIALVLI